MSKKLKKGQKLNISNALEVLDKLAIGLSWNDSHHSEKMRDIDMSAFMVANDGKVPEEPYFVYYNNSHSPDRSLLHKGDNRSGQGVGDDETIWLNLEAVDRSIAEIILVASIYNNDQTIDNFSEVSQIVLRIYNRKPDVEIAQYVINTAHTNATAFQLGRFYRSYGNWFFEALEEGRTEGLLAFVDQYA